MTKIDLNIPEDSWERCGGEESIQPTRLLTTVFINGVAHHLEALEVYVNENGIQETIDPLYMSNYEGMCMASEPDSRYQITVINGRNYVLLMTPHC